MSDFDYATLRVERDGEHVLVVTLDRPEALNAIDTQMGRDLADLWARLADAPDHARCVVLTGAGDRTFCAGADLRERDGMSDADWHAQHEIFEQGFAALLACPVPVIAAVNGHAFGGGLELALACDFVYAVRGARFGLPEVGLGIMPGGGGTQTLPRAAGERRAKELILTGQPFSAEEAHAWGIVNKLCDAVVDDALTTARHVAHNAPLSVRHAKRAIRDGLRLDYAIEIAAYDPLVGTEDRLEGVRAFNEKRKPVFKGR